MRGEREAAVEARRWAESVWPYIHEARAAGAFSLREIADALNERSAPLLEGDRWSSLQVSRLVRGSESAGSATR